MRLLWAVLTLSLCISFTACDRGDSAAGYDEDEEEYETPEERRYAKAGQPFAAAIAKGDFDAAYAMLSSHAQARYTPQAFRAAHKQARAEYFVPLSSEPAYVLETDPNLLAGRPNPDGDEMDQAFDKITIQRDVGDVPADVPESIRRASLSAAFYDVANPDEAEARCCFLTFLLVEEAGELKVAHWFYRWYDMLD